MHMKNAIRVLTLIAFTGSALMASASPSFAAAHRPHPVAHKAVAMKHKRAPKKKLINLERGKKSRKGRKAGRKTSGETPVINQA
jgi:hypothetical protein